MYDAFGNTTEVSTQPTHSGTTNFVECGELLPRKKITTYDNEGRFVISQSNGVFTEKTIEVDKRNAFGQPTEVKNADKVATHLYYDKFGSTLGAFVATGELTKTINVQCESDIGYCAFISEEYKNDTRVKRTFVDRLGRAYKTELMDVNGKTYTTHNEYDIHGRVTKSYSTTYYSTDFGQVENTYNAFDTLLKSSDIENGVHSTYSRSGLDETLSLSGNIDGANGGTLSTITTYNKFGQVASVTDARGNVLTYTYDITGNQESVKSSADGNAQLQVFTYDYLGRKVKMQDVDSGTWEYKYNVFGELVWQKDARGVETDIKYDALGRKQEVVTSNDGTSTFNYLAHQLEYEQKGQWKRSYYYDNYGRPSGSVTSVKGNQCNVSVDANIGDIRISDASLRDPLTSGCVIQQTIYDARGRVWQQFDDYRREASGTYLEARGTRFEYQNEQLYARYEAREGAQGRAYFKVHNTNDRGQILDYYKGRQLVVLEHHSNGMLKSKKVGEIFAESYDFDGIGNLTSRSDGRLNDPGELTNTQDFKYDALNRLETVTKNGVTNRYGYDENGNLTSKDGWTQTYGEAGKPLHAIAGREKYNDVLKRNVAESFDYDANGNQTGMSKDGISYRAVQYNDRNKVSSITANNETVTFEYDANNSRYKREDNEQTVYYVGALELTYPKGSELTTNVIKRYVGNDAIQSYTVEVAADESISSHAELKWLFTDYQGSIIAITNEKYEIQQEFTYDAFGKQSVIKPTAVDAAINYDLQTAVLGRVFGNLRGYTGHESLKLGDDNRVIHMNGRIYDADTGRFMQTDPFVQAPGNLQNYNRYSYVLNNPLSYTDPSGYLFKKLLKGAMQLSGSWYVYRFLNKNPLLRNLVNVGLNFAPGCTAWCSALFTGTSKFVESGSLGKAFKSGLTSYATAWAFSQIGDAFGAKAGFWKEGGIAHLGAHALTGGIISDVQGGNFGHGFWSAGLTKGAQVSGIVNMDSVVVGTAQSMVIAGTISKLTGGKFANAAVTGAFQYLYNAKGGNAGKGLFKAFKDLKRHFYGDDRTRQQKIAEYTQELMDDLHMPADKAYEQAKKFYSGNKNSLPKPPTGRGAVPADERDPKRLFTSSERTIKREQQNYQCANGCGTIIDANNSAGHHIIRWADGGPTVSENHAEVCTECHKSLHSRRKK